MRFFKLEGHRPVEVTQEAYEDWLLVPRPERLVDVTEQEAQDGSGATRCCMISTIFTGRPADELVGEGLGLPVEELLLFETVLFVGLKQQRCAGVWRSATWEAAQRVHAAVVESITPIEKEKTSEIV